LKWLEEKEKREKGKEILQISDWLSSMASPTASRSAALPRLPGGSFLLLQDEPPRTPLSLSHGALASLIKNNPAAALASPFGRDDDDGINHGHGHGHSHGPEDESHHRDERRMSAILNSSNMRSMRLIGNSNPRYRWERYWKTEAELAKMPKHM
jgi:hypothetical protein